MIDAYGSGLGFILVALFLLLYSMCSLRRAIYPWCTFWMIGMFRLLIVFIEGRHRILQRSYDTYGRLRIHSVEDRGRTRAWPEHPDRSGTSIVPWF